MELLIKHQRGCQVLRAFGMNPHGLPMYRMVRADSRRQWMTGELAPKYPKYGDCYVIEKWCGPEKYGDEKAWEEAGTLGPFPREGDYEFVLPVWDAIGRPLTEPGEHHLQVIVYAVEKSAGLTRSMRWAQIQQEQERTKAERTKVLEAMIADARPLRGGEAERKYAVQLEEDIKHIPAMTPGASLSTGE